MFAFFVHSLTEICARSVDNLLICERVNVDLMLPQLMVQNIKIYQPKCPLFFYASSSSRFSMVVTTLLQSCLNEEFHPYEVFSVLMGCIILYLILALALLVTFLDSK